MIRCKNRPDWLPEEWQAANGDAPDGSGQLDVYAADDAESWVDCIRDYWSQCRGPGMQVVREHDWGGWTATGLIGPHGELCYVKHMRINHPRYYHKVRRGRHALLNQLAVRALGFQVPETLCLVERRRAGCIVESILITKTIEDIHSVTGIINENAGNWICTLSQKRALLRAVAEEVARWHRAELFHGDLHLGNLFCRKTPTGVEFFWLDNEEGRLYRRLPRSRRVHDLNHIIRQKHKLTRADRMRMWVVYKEACDLSSDEVATLQSTVLRKTRAFWKKKGWL